MADEMNQVSTSTSESTGAEQELDLNTELAAAINEAANTETSPEAAAGPTPAGPPVAEGGQPPQQPMPSPVPNAAQQQAWNLREAARGYGLDLSQFPSEQDAFAAIMQHQTTLNRIARERQQFQQEYGQQFAEFLEHRRAEQEKQQQGQQAGWWNPPEYDPRWSSEILRDEQGNMQLRAGSQYGSDIVGKVQAYQRYQREFADRFFSNPAQALEGFAADIRRQAVEEVQGLLSTRDTNAVAHNFLQQNHGWMYDQQGQVTPAGQSYHNNVNMLAKAGITDPAVTNHVAQQLVYADMARQGLLPNNNVQDLNTQQKEHFVANAAARVPNSGMAVTQGSTGAETQTTGMSLEEMLRHDLAANGHLPQRHAARVAA